MISVSYSEIPIFLQCGSLFNSFGRDEQDGKISFPDNCFSAEDIIDSQEDFARMVRVTAFWGLYRIPTSLIQYCKITDPSIWRNHVCDECTELDFAHDLLTVFDGKGSFVVRQTTPLGRAIVTGRDEIVTYLAAEICNSTEPAECAASLGRLDYLKLLHKHEQLWDAAACAMAAKAGHIDCLVFLHEHGCGWDKRVYLQAAEHGHFDCIQYSFENGLPWPDQEGSAYSTIIERIVKHNRFEMLMYVIENDLPLSAEALVTAAAQGQIDFVYALLDASCSTNEDATWYDCQAGHFDILQVLHQYGVLFHPSCTSVAAEKGDLDILTYLHENGCAWNEDATLSAVRAGQVNTLRYAMENDCPCDQEIIFHAAQCATEGGLQCLNYLLNEVQLYQENGAMTFTAAFVIGNYEALQCLLEHGAPYNDPYEDIEDEIMAGIYIHLQDNDICDYDERLQKCILCASSYDVAFVAPESRFAEYICGNSEFLPICTSFYRYKAV